MRRTWTSLKRRADFLRIAASGLRRVTPAFIVQAARVEAPAAPNIAQPSAQRLGFTVSRKVGNAVARNRAKRRLRAMADHVIGSRVGEAQFEYVLVGRADALTRDFATMAEDLRQALEKLAVAKPTPPRRSA